MTDDRNASLREAQRLEDQHGSSDPYGAAIRATRMPIVITDALQPDNPIVFANDAFLQLTGYSRDEVVGRNCRFLQGAETDRGEVLRIRAAIDAGEAVVAEIKNYRKTGEPFWNALYVSPVFSPTGEITHFFASQLDVTQKIQSAADLRDANIALSQAKAMAEKLVEERTRDLRYALEQKTLLLHEVDHRVKNNLQLIASLILLQTRRIPDPDVRRTLRSMLDRVSALATVHRKLYQSDDVGVFDVAAFIRDIATELVGSTGRDDLALDLDLETVIIKASRAAPVALVVNELLTNALKHAFPDGRAGRIRVAAKPDGPNFVIEVEDDGVGGPGATEDEKIGFGQSLVDLLSRQLSATVERRDGDPGLVARVTIPIHPHQAGEGVEG